MFIRCFCSRSHATGKHEALKVCTVRANGVTESFRFHEDAIEDNLQDIRHEYSWTENSRPYGDIEQKAKVLMHIRGGRQRTAKSFKRERRPSDLDNEIY